jgi:hypothetical protein
VTSGFLPGRRDYFIVTFPPIILLAGLPRIMAGRANSEPQLGHFKSPAV